MVILDQDLPPLKRFAVAVASPGLAIDEAGAGAGFVAVAVIGLAIAILGIGASSLRRGVAARAGESTVFRRASDARLDA